MEALRDKHRMELDGCRRELQSLETQHKCRVEAVEEENRKICEDITQVNNPPTAYLYRMTCMIIIIYFS